MVDDNQSQQEKRADRLGSWPLSRREFGGLTASTLAAIQFGALTAGATKDTPDKRESTSYEVEGLKSPAEILVDQWGPSHVR